MSTLVDPVLARSPFPITPFGRLVRRSKEDGKPDLESLSVFLGQGVVPRSSRDDNYNRLGADLSKYLVVRPDDLVFNKLRTWQGGFGRSRYEGIVSPAYFVCRPKPDVDSRYLHFLLLCAPYMAELTRLSKFMPPSQFDIIWDDLKLLPIPVPPPATQRAIADHLDIETARIDSLIVKKRRMIGLLDQRLASERERVVGGRPGSVWTILGRFVRSITQGASPQASNFPAEGEEWGLLKLSAVKAGRFVPGENKALPPEYLIDSRLVPIPGDLLVTRSNTPAYVGDACVVTENPGQVLLCDLIYRLRLTKDLLPEFAAQVLLTQRSRIHLASNARGTSQSMVKLRGEDIKATPVPIIEVAEQERVVAEMGGREATIENAQDCLRQQITLLVEHRQALITAAITGELTIRGTPA